MTLAQLPEAPDRAERALPSATAARETVPELGYRNYWYPAVPSHKLKAKPLAVRLLGENIVLFRSRGTVRALQDRCAHRGMPLSLGKVWGKGTIMCPYHGWAFNGEGMCVAAITEGPHSKIPGRARVPAYPVEERFGTIWVFVGDMTPTPPLDDEIPDEIKDADHLAYLLVLSWKANWRLVVENVVDPSHAPLLHRNSLRFLFRTSRAYTHLHIADNAGGNGFYIDPGVHELEKVGTEYPGAGRFPERAWWRRGKPTMNRTLNGSAMTEMRLPGWLRTDNRPWHMIQWAVPVDVGTSRQYTWIWQPAKGLDAVLARAHWHLSYQMLQRQFLGQDKWACEAQEAANALHEPEKLSINDAGVIRWRRLAAKARPPYTTPPGGTTLEQ